MSAGVWVVARDVRGRLVACLTERHLDDLSLEHVLVDEEMGLLLGLGSVGITWSRPVAGRPFERADVHPEDGAAPLVLRLADAASVQADAMAVDVLDPAVLVPPPADVAAELRAAVDAAWRAEVERLRPPDDSLPPADDPAEATPPAETLSSDQIEAYEAFSRVLTARDLAVVTLRYGLKDGVVRSLEEVAEATGLSVERVRQIDRAALIRVREMG